MSGCWYPENHTYTGECEGRLVLPHYNTMPDYIQIYDIAVEGFPKRWQRRMWRKAVRVAITRWGLDFKIAEKTRPMYRPHGITIGEYVPVLGYGGNNYGGFGLAPLQQPWSSEPDEGAIAWEKGFVMMSPKTIDDAFAGRNPSYLTGVLCHELGHALGFGHGGTGIMMSVMDPPYVPNDEELIALYRYWRNHAS